VKRGCLRGISEAPLLQIKREWYVCMCLAGLGGLIIGLGGHYVALFQNADTPVFNGVSVVSSPFLFLIDSVHQMETSLYQAFLVYYTKSTGRTNIKFQSGAVLPSARAF
jgi:hypothetical protein